MLNRTVYFKLSKIFKQRCCFLLAVDQQQNYQNHLEKLKMGEIVDDGRNCYLCRNIFDDPRTLPCGHSFCLSCLTSHFSESTGRSIATFCPECETPVTCHNRSADYFPKNSSLVRTLRGDTVSSQTIFGKQRRIAAHT